MHRPRRQSGQKRRHRSVLPFQIPYEIICQAFLKPYIDVTHSTMINTYRILMFLYAFYCIFHALFNAYHDIYQKSVKNFIIWVPLLCGFGIHLNDDQKTSPYNTHFCKCKAGHPDSLCLSSMRLSRLRGVRAFGRWRIREADRR